LQLKNLDLKGNQMSDTSTIALSNALESNDKLAIFIHRDDGARKMNKCDKIFLMT